MQVSTSSGLSRTSSRDHRPIQPMGSATEERPVTVPLHRLALLEQPEASSPPSPLQCPCLAEICLMLSPCARSWLTLSRSKILLGRCGARFFPERLRTVLPTRPAWKSWRYRARPAFDLSRINSRSNSAAAPRTWSRNRDAGFRLSVSRAWVVAMNRTRWQSNSRRLARQSRSDRPNLSSFQHRTTSSFLALASSISRFNPGLLADTPLIVS
jgi:hypothetical protein